MHANKWAHPSLQLQGPFTKDCLNSYLAYLILAVDAVSTDSPPVEQGAGIANYQHRPATARELRHGSLRCCSCVPKFMLACMLTSTSMTFGKIITSITPAFHLSSVIACSRACGHTCSHACCSRCRKIDAQGVGQHQYMTFSS